jgi:type 1 fimbriae regulatory protein FimB/type 1 fimbriae regulatory protein FimE
MANARLRLVAPTTINRTVLTPRRRPNRELRTREHLTADEVERLIETVKNNRHVRAGTSFIMTRSLRQKRKACHTCSHPGL